MTRIEELGAWPARVCWVALALVAGATVGDALHDRSRAVQVVAAVGLWTGWGGALVALLVPRDVALTALRTLVPGGLVVAVIAVAAGDPVDVFDVAAVAVAAVATVAVMAPWIGEIWVDGSSYGPERRFTLRAPAALSYALVPLTWCLVAGGATVGPLLLASRQWAAGAIAAVVGAVLVWAGVRSLHQLARRWVVLVPAGLVLHDPLTLPEPQLFVRRMVANLGPAAADTTADDLTAGAPGLALQLDLNEPADLLVRQRDRRSATRSSTSGLFTPSRPRRLLEAARERRIPVG